MLRALNIDFQKKSDPKHSDTDKPGYDFEQEYDVIYSQLSDYAHSGVRLLHKFLVEDSYRPTKKKGHIVAWSTTDWLSQIVGYTAAAFELGFDEKVYDAQKQALTLLRSNHG